MKNISNSGHRVSAGVENNVANGDNLANQKNPTKLANGVDAAGTLSPSTIADSAHPAHSAGSAHPAHPAGSVHHAHSAHPAGSVHHAHSAHPAGSVHHAHHAHPASAVDAANGISVVNVAKSRTARATVINRIDLDSIGKEAVLGSTISDMLSEYWREIDALKQEIALLDEGNLIIRQKKRTKGFSVRHKGKERGISTDRKTIYNLARRRYGELRIVELLQTVEKIESIYRTVGDGGMAAPGTKAINRFADAGLDLLRILFTDKQNKWIDESYTPNPYHQRNLKYQTESGIWVRSNGELKIANALESLGIPYRCDDIVQIYDENTGKLKSYFADFKVPNFAGGISMLEHLGGFGFEGYSENAMERLNAYSNCRDIRNEEIFWSFESTVNNPDELQRLISRMMMPF